MGDGVMEVKSLPPTIYMDLGNLSLELEKSRFFERLFMFLVSAFFFGKEFFYAEVIIIIYTYCASYHFN